MTVMIITERRGNVDVVKMTDSKLNALTADVFREEVAQLFTESHTRVIINLSGVEYIDSTGFGALLTLLRTARGSYGALKLCCIGEHVRKVFETLHLNTVFEIHENLEECVLSFG